MFTGILQNMFGYFWDSVLLHWPGTHWIPGLKQSSCLSLWSIWDYTYAPMYPDSIPIIFGSTGVLTEHHWRHIPSPFCFNYFSYRVLSLCPSWSGSYLPIPFSWDDRDMPLCPSFTGWNEFSWIFCPGWSWIAIVLISTSPVEDVSLESPCPKEYSFLTYSN
jgi:hypothetical protein